MDLIEHLSRLSLWNQDVNSDVLGEAYEYLIKKFADATNKKAVEFYTPRSVARLMIDMLDPQEGETIIQTMSHLHALIWLSCDARDCLIRRSYASR